MKIPLHADELRIGYFEKPPARNGNMLLLIAVAVIIVAALVYFNLKAANKLPWQKDEQ